MKHFRRVAHEIHYVRNKKNNQLEIYNGILCNFPGCKCGILLL